MQSKRKRTAYKPLFLRAKQQARVWEDRAHLAEHEIKRLQSVLATDYEDMKGYLKFKVGTGPIEVLPLEYERLMAWIRSSAQVTSSEPYYSQSGFTQTETLYGRPVVRF